MAKIKVSVIIPVYNTEIYLEKCLRSILNQELNEIEIICIDDCSSDGAVNILKDFARSDPRVKVIQNEQNSRQAECRNIGMRLAQGDYISFIDSDDCIERDFLNKIYNAAIDNDADLAGGWAKFIQGSTNEILQFWEEEISGAEGVYEDSGKDILLIKVGLIGTCWRRLYRKNFLEKNKISFDSSITPFEDCLFSFETVLLANKIAHVKTYYNHYKRLSSSVHNLKRVRFIYPYVMQKINSILQAKDDKLRKQIMDHYIRKGHWNKWIVD